MRFTPWATRLVLTLSLSATAFLTACGGGGGGGGSTAQVRLLNATLNQTSLDLVVGTDTTVSSKVTQGTAGSYGSVDTNNPSGNVTTSGSGTSVAVWSPTLTGNSNYTVIAYNSAGIVRTSLLQENQDAPASGKAKLLVLNLAPDAGPVDVYLLGSGDSPDTATPAVTNNAGGGGSGYIQLNSGTFRVRVTGTGVRGDVRLDIPAVTLDSASINTLLLTNTVSGSLVTGTQVVQQGKVTNFANPLARVRVLNGLAGSPIVSATVADSTASTTTTILAASRPLNLSSYVTFNGGAGTVTVLIDGVAKTLPTSSFVAGQDYTVLVWGPAAGAQVKAVKDDNTLPSVNGNVKIRLINALSDPSATATLNVNSQDVQTAINVATGSSSDSFSSANYANGGNGVPVVVTSPFTQSGDPLWVQSGTVTSPGNTVLQANGVYTVVVTGDPTAVRGRLYKDR
ncbi:hypothetical protein J2X20_003554 [Pelomonas saccharophila]|uniref:DUF4397 domain-containing protein n=1 Tax=Roseateles saccharophilus TaxID=304 RepID=A0ABU1YSD4_ROSSA|nr:DUF4397 domain-containing protein [Roseateles saccharophilus]MDR7270896.1 hypothetical protein [Roseateles saccharophilus]